MYTNESLIHRLSAVSVILPALAKVYPALVDGVFFQFFRRQLDGVVLFSRGREHGRKALYGNIQIHFDAFVYAEGADAAGRVTDLFFHFGKGKHVGFHAEKVLESGIIDFCIPGSYN